MRKQVVKRAAQSHRVDHQSLVFGQLQPDDLEQVAGAVGADREHSRWIRVGVEVDDSESVRDGMKDRLAVDAVLVR